MSITHSKTSSQPDSGDAALVQPSDWNDDHEVAIATGKVLVGTGSSSSEAYPPGYLIDSNSATSNVTVSGTSEGSPTSVLAGNSVTYDGGAVRCEFCAPGWAPDSSVNSRDIRLYFRLDGTSQGIAALKQQTVNGTVAAYDPCCVVIYLTPSAGAHTISVVASRTGGDGVILAGAGGSGNVRPMTLRITKV